MSAPRRTLGLLASAVVAAGLLAGSAVPALADVMTGIPADRCVTTGGAHGYGYMRLKVDVSVSGEHMERLVAVFTPQHREPGQAWVDGDAVRYRAPDVHPPYEAALLTRALRVDFGPDDLSFEHRIVVRLRYLDVRPGPDRLVGSSTYHGKVCGKEA